MISVIYFLYKANLIKTKQNRYIISRNAILFYLINLDDFDSFIYEVNHFYLL